MYAFVLLLLRLNWDLCSQLSKMVLNICFGLFFLPNQKQMLKKESTLRRFCFDRISKNMHLSVIFTYVLSMHPYRDWLLTLGGVEVVLDHWGIA